MTSPDRIPVIVGVGQSIERDEITTPHRLLERAARAALVDAGGIERHIDRISVVNILNQGGQRPAGRLAHALRLDPARVETTTVGGNTPISLLLDAAEAIAAGHDEAVLICGAEAMRSSRLVTSGAAKPPKDERDEDVAIAPDPVIGDDRVGVHNAELAAGLVVPAHVYAALENVLAARAGRTPSEHRTVLGELMAPFTEVAAKHPFAWFPEAATPAELAEPSSTNRLTAEPYTKRFNAYLGVDQGAAFVVSSLARAAELGLDGQAAFVWAGASCNDVFYVGERPDPGRSPGIAAAADATFAAAGRGIDDVGLLDLYSCFPVAVELAADALGIATDDRRGLTVTGGLPYFGGPGNNYPSHAVATAVERLRERGGLGLVTGLGWYATKHSVVLLGSEPPPTGFHHPDLTAEQAAIDATARPLVTDYTGEATVVAGTVAYGQSGTVDNVLVIAETDDGRRVAARPAGGLGSYAGENVVGRRIRVDATSAVFRPLDA